MPSSPRRTLLDFQRKYTEHKPLTMVTAYDFLSAKLVDSSPIDSILVGDSYKMVMAGEDSTVPATLVRLPSLPLLIVSPCLGRDHLSLQSCYKGGTLKVPPPPPQCPPPFLVSISFHSRYLMVINLSSTSTLLSSFPFLALCCAYSLSFVVGDLPFGSYEASTELAIQSATRLLKEGRVHAVKLEGGARMVPQVRAIADAGIPVMGHIGLTPQGRSFSELS